MKDDPVKQEQSATTVQDDKSSKKNPDSYTSGQLEAVTRLSLVMCSPILVFILVHISGS